LLLDPVVPNKAHDASISITHFNKHHPTKSFRTARSADPESRRTETDSGFAAFAAPRNDGEKETLPLQNRVTPFGAIVATPQRGRFTGNRGIIHDPATRTLLKRRWTARAWIACVCEFRGRRRQVMATLSWTELFFLDEATAFAAGHRPCTPGENVIAEAFRDAWRNFVHFVAAFIASLGTVVPVALLAGIAALAWRRWRGPRRPTALQPKEAH